MRILTTAALLWMTAASGWAAVRGVVGGDDGKPLEGIAVRAFARESSAEVRARLLSATPEAKPIAAGRTGADGAFSLDVNQPVVTVAIDGPGRELAFLDATTSEDLGGILLRSERPAAGRVTGDGGKPVANALIVVGLTYIIRSDEQGRFAVPPTRGSFDRFFVTHPDYAPFESSLSDRTSTRGGGSGNFDIRLTRGVTLRGRVLAADGAPVAGASITVAGWPLGKSGEDGTFAIDRAPESRAIVATSNHRAGVAGSSNEIRLRDAANIAGTLRSSKDDAPIAGGRVQLALTTDRTSAVWVNADAKGNFSLPALLPGSYRLTTTHPDFQQQLTTVQVAGAGTVTRAIAATPYGRVTGRVIDEERRPVSGAQVQLGGASRVGMTLVTRNDEAVTTTDGRFSIRIRNVAPFVLAAKKSGYASGTAGPVAVPEGETRSGVSIVLPAGFPFRLRVVDAQNQPVPNASVTMQRWTDDTGSSRETVSCESGDDCLVTGSDGSLDVRITEGKYDIRVRGEGVVGRRLAGEQLTPRVSPMTVTVESGVEIRGKVVFADGQPAPNAYVQMSPGESDTHTGADGTFVIRSAPRGEVRLVAEVWAPVRMYSDPHDVTAPATNVVLTFAKTIRVEGRVIEKGSRRPITDFTVGFFRRAGPSPAPQSFHSDDGSFSLEAAAASGSDLFASSPGYVRATLADVRPDAESGIARVELQLERGARVTGRVTSAGGRAAPNVSVSSDPGRSYAPDQASTVTDANGDYTLDGVAAGERHIRFFGRGFLSASKSVSVESGKDARLDVELSRGREVRGRVIDTTAQPVALAYVSGRSGDSRSAPSVPTDADGAFVLEGLPDGRLTIQAQKQGFVEAQVEDIDPATTPAITLTLSRGGTLTGRVTGLSPAELGNVHVTARSRSHVASGSVDVQGNFTINGVPDGRISVAASTRPPRVRQSAPKSIEVVNGSAPPIELAFNDGFTVRGRVTMNGQPAGAGNVNFRLGLGAESFNASFQQSGTYEISGFTPGEYHVTVFLHSLSGPVYSETRTISGTETYDIDIRGAALRGRVVDARSGNAIPDAFVTLDSSGRPGGSRSVNSDSDGRFVLQALGEGKYRLRTQVARYASETQDVEVAGTAPVEVEVRLEPAQKLSVRVTDGRDGKPVPYATMFLTQAGGGTVLSDLRRGTDDGGYDLWALPGRYDLRINTPGYVPYQLTVDIPSPTVNVALMKAGALLIRSRSAVMRLRLKNEQSGEVRPVNVARSEMRFDTLAPGAYTVELLTERGEVVRRVAVVVTAGETATVDLE